ncbi:unnamed protein product [Amaranthus hypochondriacus]
MLVKPYRTITPTISWPWKNITLKRTIRFQPKTATTQLVTISMPDNHQVSTKEISMPDNWIRTKEIDDEVVAFWDYQFLFMSQRLEVSNPIKLKLIEGALPKYFPSGTYYLIGPGLFIDDYGSTIHPLDGHGYLRAFEIDGPNGEVKFWAKYVKTEAHMEECDPITGSWKFTHRGPFSVLKRGKKVANTKVMKNVANTSILKWGERLFSLWEGGTPYEIDPKTLNTIGNFNFIHNDDDHHDHHDDDEVSIGQSHAWDVVAHMLKPILHGIFKMPPKRLLSHYKIDSKRGRLIIMACNAEDMVLPTSHYTFYELDQNFKLLQVREFTIPDHSMIHDWAFTDTHYILFTNHVKLDILGSMAAISGQAPMISALSVNKKKPTTSIYLLPRFPNTKNSNEYWKKAIEAPQLWLLHVANAFEQIDDHGNLTFQIHVTACAYQWFNFQNMFGYNWQSDILDPSIMNSKEGKEQLFPHLFEVTIKLDKNGKDPKCKVTCLNKRTRSSDFPIINPKYCGYKHRYVYAAASSGSHQILSHFPFDTILKFDNLTKKVSTWSPGSRRFVGEPIFISKQSFNGEDDGYLLVVEYVASRRKCNLVILDAKRVGEVRAVVARFEVPKSFTFPLGFHGTWTSKQD